MSAVFTYAKAREILDVIQVGKPGVGKTYLRQEVSKQGTIIWTMHSTIAAAKTLTEAIKNA